MTTTTRASFHLGRLLITPGAKATIPTYDILEALSRHQRGDWGDLDAEDKATNDYALEHGERLMSAYTSGDTRFWIITEWDRSATTILLPDEY